jgi:Zn-dependent protease with chaperone function
MDNRVYRHEPVLKGIALVISVAAWVALLAGTMGAALLYMLAFFIFYLFAHSALIAYLRGNAVQITPAQMPDLHERIERCSRTLGLAEVPEAYLLHGNGVFNAFTTRFLGRNFIVLLSDVVDALEAQPDAVDFYIGHELGHIVRKHLQWGPLLAPALILPLLGAAYSRAREYTCDRHGLACCPRPNDALRGMAALAAGHERWRTVDLAQYAEQAGRSGGFWMSFHELTGDYPWLTKRVAWLAALAEGHSPSLPRRHPLAWLLALFIPRIAVGGGGGVLVTVAMIGILAAIAIPAYQDYVIRTQVAEGEAIAAQVEAHLLAQYRQNHSFPQDNAAAGLKAPEEIHGTYVEAVEVADGEIHIVYGGQSNPKIAGATLAYVGVASADGARISWNCAGPGTTVPNKYRPLACRQ